MIAFSAESDIITGNSYICRKCDITVGGDDLLLEMYISAINSPEDRELFEMLYDKYRLILIDDAFAILKNENDAQDVVQEVYLRVAMNMDKIDFSVNPVPLLRAVTRNYAINLQKRQRKEYCVFECDEFANCIDVPSDVENKNDVEMIADFVEKMPESYADIFIMKYSCDLSNMQIAAMLDIKPSTVRKRLQRLREMIAERFLVEEKGENDE